MQSFLLLINSYLPLSSFHSVTSRVASFLLLLLLLLLLFAILHLPLIQWCCSSYLIYDLSSYFSSLFPPLFVPSFITAPPLQKTFEIVVTDFKWIVYHGGRQMQLPLVSTLFVVVGTPISIVRPSPPVLNHRGHTWLDLKYKN